MAHKKLIYLNISDLASAIDLNPYRKPAEVLKRVWSSDFHAQFAAAQQRVAQRGAMAPQDLSETVKQLVQDNPSIRDRLESAVGTESMDERQQSADALVQQTRAATERAVVAEIDRAWSTSALPVASVLHQQVSHEAQSLREICDKLGQWTTDTQAACQQFHTDPQTLRAHLPAPIQQLTSTAQTAAAMVTQMQHHVLPVLAAAQTQLQQRHETLPTVVSQVVAAEIHGRRGHRDEPKALAMVQQQVGAPVTGNNGAMYYTTIPTTPIAVRLGGRVDGWLDPSTIVEVKNRQKRLLCAVPVYEKAQVQAYLLATGAAQCRFLERYGDQSWSTTLTRDPEWWRNTVLTGLQHFVDDLMRLLSDESMQDEYVV